VLYALGDKADIALAADKLTLSDRLASLGLPVAPIRTVVVPGQNLDLSLPPWTRPEKLLVKPRHGAHAKGLFSIKSLPGGRFSISGGPPVDPSELYRRLMSAARQDSLLVQAFIGPSADTRDFSPDAPPIIRAFTMRVKPGERASVASAILKILPPGRDAPDTRDVDELTVFPIDLESGIPGDGILFGDPRNRVSGRRGRALAGWPAVQEMVVRASDILPGVPVIGWDVLLGPDGPVILEANTWVGMFRAMLWHFEHGVPSPLHAAIESWCDIACYGHQ